MWAEGGLRGRPRGVRTTRPLRVTVCQSEMGIFPCGLRSEDQEEASFMAVCTPVALWVPSTPADIGDSIVPSSDFDLF